MICCSDIGRITYFQAEVHATANCPWTRRPAFHFVAYEISGFRVLINQSGNGHSCIRSQNQLPAADALKKQRVVLARDAVLQHLLEKGLELRPRHVVAREEHTAFSFFDREARGILLTEIEVECDHSNASDLVERVVHPLAGHRVQI